MKKFVRLAWRNVWRNRRRSLITIVAIAFAVLIVAVMRSLQYGTYDAMESLAVGLYNGDFQLQHRGFFEEQTLNYFLPDEGQEWRAALGQQPEITAYSRRVTGFGLVSSDSSSTGALIVGIEPEREKRVTSFAHMVAVGEPLRPADDHAVLLGQTLATNLQVGVDDTVVVLTQGYHNEMGADSYVVKGLLKLGNTELDRGLMIMLLHNAQDLFSLHHGVTQIVFRTVDFRHAEQVASSLSRHLNPAEYNLLSWQKMMPELKQIILVDNIGGAFYLVFLLLVVAFEIFNTTMMSVMERSREFGVLQSLGMKPGQLGVTVALESTFKVFLGLAIGLALSFAFISVLSHYSIPLSREIKEGYAQYGFMLEDLKFSRHLRVFGEPLFSIALLTVLALIYPIVKTVRLEPLEAFRKT
ncbi:MAG: ABC transporter permease [bacterium]